MHECWFVIHEAELVQHCALLDRGSRVGDDVTRAPGSWLDPPGNIIGTQKIVSVLQPAISTCVRGTKKNLYKALQHSPRAVQ